MEVLHQRCAGVDIGKKFAKVCVRVPGEGRKPFTETVTTWGSMTRQILELREHLIAQQVTCVVMEATGDYWKPYYYLLEDAEFEVMLVNAHHVKNLPGRKSDVSDAKWLAQLCAHGLVRASLVPPPPVRQLRDLTRARTTATRDRTREWLRLEKLLEDAGIKLSAVVTSLAGVSARRMLEAMIAGERDPHTLTDLAYGPLRRAKGPALVEALTGRFVEHHAFMVRMHLDRIDQLDASIQAMTDRIEVVMEPFRGFRDLICSIPGISTVVADTITAETGGDMSVFPSAKHLASWAGVCPGSNESAGVVKSSRTRPGNAYLKGALGIAGMSAARTKGTYLSVKYKRITARRGPKRALVALEHDMLTTIWHIEAPQV